MNYLIDGFNMFSIIMPSSLISMAAISLYSGFALDQYLNYKKWEIIFINCGLNIKGEIPKLIKTENNDMGKRYVFSLPAGLCLSDFEKLQEELETALNEPIKCDLTNNYKLVIQTYHLEYEKEYSLPNISTPANKLLFHAGVTLTTSGAKNVSLEFNRSNSHMLVCGMTGKGKTVFMQNIIAQSMLKKTEVYICDLKATGSYNVFKSCRNLMKLVKSEEDTNMLLDELLNVMKDRYKTIDRLNCSDQEEYNKRSARKMKNIILVIEEFVILNNNKKAINILNVLLAQASGAGIHIFLTIQRPDYKSLDTRLKSNLSYTVAFKAKNSSNSEIYLDKGDFRAYKDLHNKGEAILLTDNEDIFFKSYYITKEKIENMVKCTYIEKKLQDALEEKGMPKEKPDNIIRLQPKQQALHDEGKVDLL